MRASWNSGTVGAVRGTSTSTCRSAVSSSSERSASGICVASQADCVGVNCARVGGVGCEEGWTPVAAPVAVRSSSARSALGDLLRGCGVRVDMKRMLRSAHPSAHTLFSEASA
eukprot:366170-Chlamydomonas_euryale.AAC.1